MLPLFFREVHNAIRNVHEMAILPLHFPAGTLPPHKSCKKRTESSGIKNKLPLKDDNKCEVRVPGWLEWEEFALHGGVHLIEWAGEVQDVQESVNWRRQSGVRFQRARGGCEDQRVLPLTFSGSDARQR